MPDISITQSATAILVDWYSAKTFFERSLSFSTDSLHVIAGVMLQVAVALLVRRPLTTWLPWLCVLGLLAVNEAADLSAERWPLLAEQLGESAKDLLLTMLLPSLLMLALRWSPSLAQPRHRGR